MSNRTGQSTDSGETILIHPGTSANGLAAIQVCRQRDCRILVTASTDEKRQYLVDQCGIPAANIFNPNDVNIVDQILTATGGLGVDIVFDSMSSDRLITSFPIIADYGRYIEIDHHHQSSASSQQLPRNTHYYNISSLISEDSFESIIPKLFNGFANWLQEASSEQGTCRWSTGHHCH